MLAKIVTKSSYYPQMIDPVLVWEGALDAVPREGDFIEVFDGWASARVESVTWILSGGYVKIEIGPDTTGEYAAQLEMSHD